MIPVLIDLGPIKIHSYGLMLAVAVLICTVCLVKEGKKAGLSADLIVDLIFWIVISGILGARIFFIFLYLEYFLTYPIEIIMIQNGGLAWQGGLIAALLTGIVFVRKKGLDLLMMMDLFAPYVALGQSIGRIGCFLNGCCYGIAASWGMYFPVHDAHLHPTQLYSSFGLLVIFFVLKAYQKRKPVKGSVIVMYLVLAPLWRFVVEFFRADSHPTFLGLSIYQIVCLALLTTALTVHSRISKAS